MTAKNAKSDDGAGAPARESLRSRIGWMPLLLGVAGLAVIAMIAFALNAGSATSPSSDVLPISNQMSTILEVNPLMTLGTPAPVFTLTDQNGVDTSLSAFTGKAVVLTFGDDKCTDLCTLLAEDVLAADGDLGSNASNVQFVSINANTFYPSVAATKSWTDAHGLGHTANWHFLTGNSATLAALAKRYGVEVDLHPKSRTIDHGTELFFISPNGNEEQIGDFGTESANTAEFSHSMAQLANELLPANEQHTVGGSTSTVSEQVDTAIGKTPPPIELPALGTHTPTTLSAYRGKYIAVNFWSPTCSLCVHELPAMEHVYRSEGTTAAVIGIDVSDPGDAGNAFASEAGASYPMLSDAQGAIAAQYEIPGLPYTVILDPNGKVVVRHPGEMTAEQLQYILNTLTAEAPTGS
jgi:cytochrome oxidase Cu insertion factor (SCO1/SenC/PrrC family)/thiol-disulfide isomerase/thioredoxin